MEIHDEAVFLLGTGDVSDVSVLLMILVLM